MPHDTPLEHLKNLKVAGVVFSGGPASVYSPGAPKPDERILRDSIPILGICYGYQLIVQANGGEVVKAASREYGKSSLSITERGSLFASHPTYGERIAAIESFPAAAVPDGKPALELFDRPDEIEQELTQFLTEYLAYVHEMQAGAATQQ